MQETQGNIPLYTEAPRPPRVDLGRVPFIFIAAVIIAVFASWIPLAYFARARATLSKEPRVSLMQDMGVQPKFRGAAEQCVVCGWPGGSTADCRNGGPRRS